MPGSPHLPRVRFFAQFKGCEQALCLAAALLMIAPGLVPTLVGAAIALPVLLRQVAAHRRLRAAA